MRAAARRPVRASDPQRRPPQGRGSETPSPAFPRLTVTPFPRSDYGPLLPICNRRGSRSGPKSPTRGGGEMKRALLPLALAGSLLVLTFGAAQAGADQLAELNNPNAVLLTLFNC